MKFSLARRQLDVILLAVLQSEMKEELELVKVGRYQNTVISLSNGSDMDITSSDEVELRFLRYR